MIKYIAIPFEKSVFSPANDGKQNFFDNNISLTICTLMILGKSEKDIAAYKNFHRTFYGKYLAGFAFEGYDALPPLCILQTIEGTDNSATNALYYSGTIFAPGLGVFTASEYEKQNLSVQSYAMMFIPEAYEGTDWKPFVPTEIQAELEKDTELGAFFHGLPSLEQAKILNYIHPFSKPSSFLENRKSSQPLKPAKTQQIIFHIKSLESFPKNDKTAWEELKEFETVEAVETLKKCGIAEGMTVLDFGCGHGHYTFAASIAAGSGKVIAVDSEIESKVLK